LIWLQAILNHNGESIWAQQLIYLVDAMRGDIHGNLLRYVEEVFKEYW